MAKSQMQMRPSNPALFEDSIERRGQHVLWYSASACYCISDRGEVDPNCPRCFGRGHAYRPVTSTRQIIYGVADGRAVVDVASKQIVIKAIYQLIVGADQVVPVTSYTPTTFTPATPIAKGLRWTLDFEADFEATYTGPATYLGRQVIDVPIRLVNNQNYFAGSLVSVQSLANTTRGEAMDVSAVWGNRILTLSPADPADVLAVTCQYVRAYKFLITSINPKNKVETNLVMQNSDAQMVFPGTFHVGRGDVVVLQLAEIKEMIVGINEGPGYVFPYQSIARILAVEDKYGPITDFTLVRDNEIRWGSRRPGRFACAFTYHPAFVVYDDLPTVRYSEDKIWPKRVMLKKFGSFTHPSKVLTARDPDSPDTGLIDDDQKLIEQGGLI